MENYTLDEFWFWKKKTYSTNIQIGIPSCDGDIRATVWGPLMMSMSGLVHGST